MPEVGGQHWQQGLAHGVCGFVDTGYGSGGQGGGDLRGVFGAADEAGLAVAELPVMVHVHRDVPAGGGDGDGVADEHHDVAVVIAGEGQRGELGDRPGRGDALEEADQLILAVLGAVPRGGRDRRVGGPVDVAGDPVQDGLDVPAAERFVHLLGRIDVLLGAHELLLILSRAGQAPNAATAAGSPTNWSMLRTRPPAWRAAGDARRRNAVTHRLAEAALGDAAAAEQAVIGLTGLSNMFMELYADCAGYPVDSVIRDAAALMYGDPAG